MVPKQECYKFSLHTNGLVITKSLNGELIRGVVVESNLKWTTRALYRINDSPSQQLEQCLKQLNIPLLYTDISYMCPILYKGTAERYLSSPIELDHAKQTLIDASLQYRTLWVTQDIALLVKSTLRRKPNCNLDTLKGVVKAYAYRRAVFDNCSRMHELKDEDYYADLAHSKFQELKEYCKYMEIALHEL